MLLEALTKVAIKEGLIEDIEKFLDSRDELKGNPRLKNEIIKAAAQGEISALIDEIFEKRGIDNPRVKADFTKIIKLSPLSFTSTAKLLEAVKANKDLFLYSKSQLGVEIDKLFNFKNIDISSSEFHDLIALFIELYNLSLPGSGKTPNIGKGELLMGLFSKNGTLPNKGDVGINGEVYEVKANNGRILADLYEKTDNKTFQKNLESILNDLISDKMALSGILNELKKVDSQKAFLSFIDTLSSDIQLEFFKRAIIYIYGERISSNYSNEKKKVLKELKAKIKDIKSIPSDFTAFRSEIAQIVGKVAFETYKKDEEINYFALFAQNGNKFSYIVGKDMDELVKNGATVDFIGFIRNGKQSPVNIVVKAK